MLNRFEMANLVASKCESMPAAHPWTKNELILDSVCEALSTDDLANFRLTCKTWARAGGRVLAGRSVMCVTDKEFAGKADFWTVKFDSRPQHNFWRCLCLQQRFEGMKYLSTSSSTFQQLLTWDSEFQPKKLYVLGYECFPNVTDRSIFSQVETLCFVRIPYSEVRKILVVAHEYFDNLKQLELRDIDSAAKPEQRASRCLSRQTNAEEACKLASFVPRSSKLESLAIEISPTWLDANLESLLVHPNLKRLQINWYKEERRPAIWDHIDCLDDQESFYGVFLQRMLPFVNNALQSVTEITLRFELTPTNSSMAQKFLNEFKGLKKVGLQVRGEFAALENILVGLADPVLDAVDSLHTVNLLANSEERNSDFHQLFCFLGQRGFFKKPVWSIVCRNINQSWLRITRTTAQLSIQVQGAHLGFFAQFRVIDKILSDATYFPHDYNYANHHVVSRCPSSGVNDYEILNSGALFKSYLLTAQWKSMQHCVCSVCRDSPRLLADLAGFRNDIGCTFSNNHPAEMWLRTWTFLHVPRPVLAKWRVRLVTEIAEARAKSPCQCEWWDIITRMKQGQRFKYEFTDPPDRHPLLVDGPTIEKSAQAACFGYDDRLELYHLSSKQCSCDSVFSNGFTTHSCTLAGINSSLI